MKKVLCTFPGRYGDLLWALPTVRAIAQYYQTPVDLQIAGEFDAIAPLLAQQEYLNGTITDETWAMTPPDEWKAPPVGIEYYYIHHLGYRGWPDKPLAQYIYGQVSSGWLPPLDLETPWIKVNGPTTPCEIAIGFTEAWFELKLGLLVAIDRLIYPELHAQLLTPEGSRWTTEAGAGAVAVHPTNNWFEIAGTIRNADLFFGDCSALHVLAVALGKRVLLMEPMPGRWNPIFYPLGTDGPRVTLIKGNDNQPTFDARAVADAIRAAL